MMGAIASPMNALADPGRAGMSLDWGDGAFTALGAVAAALLGWITQRRRLVADVDDLTWEHASETIKRLTSDVAAIKESRAERDQEIADLKARVSRSEKANEDCLRRENELKRRVTKLEADSRAGGA